MALLAGDSELDQPPEAEVALAASAALQRMQLPQPLVELKRLPNFPQKCSPLASPNKPNIGALQGILSISMPTMAHKVGQAFGLVLTFLWQEDQI